MREFLRRADARIHEMSGFGKGAIAVAGMVVATLLLTAACRAVFGPPTTSRDAGTAGRAAEEARQAPAVAPSARADSSRAGDDGVVAPSSAGDSSAADAGAVERAAGDEATLSGRTEAFNGTLELRYDVACTTDEARLSNALLAWAASQAGRGADPSGRLDVTMWREWRTSEQSGSLRVWSYLVEPQDGSDPFVVSMRADEPDVPAAVNRLDEARLEQWRAGEWEAEATDGNGVV